MTVDTTTLDAATRHVLADQPIAVIRGLLNDREDGYALVDRQRAERWLKRASAAIMRQYREMCRVQG